MVEHTTRHGITGPYWYGVDLDGTLCTWDPEVQGIDPLKIGPPVPVMVRRVKRWIKEGRHVRIVTARMAESSGGQPRSRSEFSKPSYHEVQLAIYEWTVKHIGTGLWATATKDCWMVELWDDRAVSVAEGTGVPMTPLPGEET